jgi:hypothetical protein
LKPSSARSWKVYGLVLTLGVILGLGVIFVWELAERKRDWPWNYWASFLPYELDLPPEHQSLPRPTGQRPLIFLGDSFSLPLGQGLKADLPDMEVLAFTGMSYTRALQWLINDIKNNTLPRGIIIALGGEEWFEQKFSLDDVEELKRQSSAAFELKNFLLWRIGRLPPAEYKWHLSKKMERAPRPTSDLEQHRKRMATTYLLKLEAQALFQILHAYQIPHLIITSPLAPQYPPKKKCLYGTSIDVGLLWKEQKELFGKQNWEAAHVSSDQLLKSDPFNPWAYYQKGRLLWKSGQRWQESVPYYQLSTILDCEDWRGNSLFNQVITRRAQDFGLKLFDWEKFMYEVSLSNSSQKVEEIESLASTKEVILAYIKKFLLKN